MGRSRSLLYYYYLMTCVLPWGDPCSLPTPLLPVMLAGVLGSNKALSPSSVTGQPLYGAPAVVDWMLNVKNPFCCQSG